MNINDVQSFNNKEFSSVFLQTCDYVKNNAGKLLLHTVDTLLLLFNHLHHRLTEIIRNHLNQNDLV